MPLERNYQPRLIKRIKAMFPGCWVLKNDANYLQGVPDWIVLYGKHWAALEIKKKKPRPGTSDFEPNQEWYIAEFDRMGFCACVYPENEREVLSALQQAFGVGRPALLPQSQPVSLASVRRGKAGQEVRQLPSRSTRQRAA